MTWLQNNWLTPWVATGLLLGIGFIFPDLWILGIAGIVYAIYLTLDEQSIGRVCLGSLLAWTVKSALVLIWCWDTYPIEWLVVDLGNWQLALIGIWWGTGALWLGLGGVVFALIVKCLQRFMSVSWVLLLLPVVWVASEMAGSFIFSVITIGPGGVVTTALSFGYVGYLATQHDLLIQFAQIAGVYSLGLLVVAMATITVWVFLQKPLYKKYVYLVATVLVVTSFVSAKYISHSSEEHYKIVVIDTDFPVSELKNKEGRKGIQYQIEVAVQQALLLEPDYILLPEDSSYFDQQSEVQLVQAQFAFRTGGSDVVIVDSGRANDNGKAVVQSFVYNGLDQVVDQSHKRYLVPQGEFMPTLYTHALKLFGQEEVIDRITQSISFVVGADTAQVDFASSSPGVLFCFESVSPWGVRKIMQERGTVPFIAHPISHAWFHQSKSLQQQLESMLRTQAIWNQEYIVSAGNQVRGYVITPTGVITYPEIVETNSDWSVSVITIPK